MNLRELHPHTHTFDGLLAPFPSFEMYHPTLVASFLDPGPHGNGRYSEHMLPEVEKKDFRKGAQVCLN